MAWGFTTDTSTALALGECSRTYSAVFTTRVSKTLKRQRCMNLFNSSASFSLSLDSFKSSVFAACAKSNQRVRFKMTGCSF